MSLPTSQNLSNMYAQLVVTLKTVADPNQSNSMVFENSDNTWNIYDGTQTEYAGTPAAILEPTDGPQSEFATSAENQRGYGYYVFIMMDTTPTNYLTTRQNMRLIVDSVLDAIDRSGMLGGTMDFVNAASFRWLKENTATGVNIVAPLLITGTRTIEVN